MCPAQVPKNNNPSETDNPEGITPEDLPVEVPEDPSDEILEDRLTSKGIPINKRIGNKIKPTRENLHAIRFAKQIGPEQTRDLIAEDKRRDLMSLGSRHKSLGSTLRDIGEREDRQTGYSMQFAMCYNAYQAAVAGDKDARNWISDRTEGKAVQRKIIQNMDIITKVIEVLERVVSDPLPGRAEDLKRMIAYEFEKLANEGDATYDI